MIKEFSRQHSVLLGCQILNIERSTYYRQKDKADFSAKYEHLKETVKEIIVKNPKYGYRRILSALSKKNIKLNHKTLRKLLKIWGLNLLRKTRKPRVNGIEQILEELGPAVNLIKRLAPETIKAFQIIYTDFTEILSKSGKLYLIPFLDHLTKKVIGYAVSKNPNLETVRVGLKIAETFLKRKGINLSKVVFHQDQGSVFKSYEYVGVLIRNNISLSYSRKGRPSDNPEMESFFGRLKDEWREVFYEAGSLEELKLLVDQAISYHNQDRIHSKLNGQSPDEFINNLIKNSQLIYTKNSF